MLSDAADFPNGAASVFPSNRITLLPVPPASEPELQNFDDWIRVILTHELAHIFHLDRVKGPWGLVQALLGRVPGTFPNHYQPSWVSEGIATYYESHFTRRGRLRGSFHTEVLLSAAGGDAWPRLNQATYLSEKWPDGIAPYAFGSRFYGYLAGAAGDSSIPRYIERTAGQWVPFRTGRPLRLATGLGRDSLWRAQASEYEERWHARPPTEAETLARGLRVQPSPAIASDGSVAWFESSLDEVSRINIRRPDGRIEHHRTTGGVDLAWNGDTLYATRLEVVNPGIYRSDLHRLIGGEWEQMTHNERLTDLAVGPTGVIAVQLTESGNRLVRVGEGILPVSPHVPPASSMASPAMDSAGNIVAAWHYQGRYHLLQLGDSGSNVVVTGRANEVLADPAFIGSDAAAWLFVSDRTGLPQIYQLGNDGSVRQITDEPFGARQPAPGREGWIYFTALEADGYALKRTKGRAGQADNRTERIEDGVIGESRDPQQSVRQSGYSPWPALRPHYFIPYLVDKGSAGYYLGAFTSGSDPVGRLGYTARLAAGFDQGRLDASVGLVYRRWNHHSVDLFFSQDNGDAGLVIAPPETLAVQSQERDAEIGFNTIWRRWYRSITFRVAGDYEEDRFLSEPQLSFINPRFGAASAGLTLGRTLRPPLAISDEDGATLSLRYRRRWRLDRDGWSDEWRTRLAGYKALGGVGGFAHPVLAARISAATSSGPDRETFGIGGASGITYQPLPGIVAGSGRAFPVRGFEAGELRGGTVAVGTAELRVPLALIAQPLWDLPYGLDRVSLRIFYDYGRVWEPPVSGRPAWIHGAGVEVTWDLVVLYDVPLRVRTGAAAALNDGSVTRQGDIRLGLGFGSEF